MNNEALSKKVNYVRELSAVITKYQKNVTSIEYEVYQHLEHETWISEFVVVNYDGGAISVRNCNGNSISSITAEISKMLEHGYYSEIDDREFFLKSSKHRRLF